MLVTFDRCIKSSRFVTGSLLLRAPGLCRHGAVTAPCGRTVGAEAEIAVATGIGVLVPDIRRALPSWKGIGDLYESSTPKKGPRGPLVAAEALISQMTAGGQRYSGPATQTTPVGRLSILVRVDGQLGSEAKSWQIRF